MLSVLHLSAPLFGDAMYIGTIIVNSSLQLSLNPPALAGERAPAADVFRPSVLHLSDPLFGDAMYIADFVSEFAPHLGLLPLSVHTLRALLKENKLAADEPGQVREAPLSGTVYVEVDP